MTSITTNCLSYEQLESYSLDKIGKEEREQVYLHITTCELCSGAVNGFSISPFTQADLNDIFQEIDNTIKLEHTTSGTSFKFLNFGNVVLAVVSLLSIAGFYLFVDSFSEKKIVSNSTEKVPSGIVNTVVQLKENNPIKTTDNISEIKSLPNELALGDNKPERTSIPLEPLNNIPAQLKPSETESTEETLIETDYNSGVVYIYDLKVANFKNLYFNNQANHIEIKGHTPSDKENKESMDHFSDQDFEKRIALTSVLKSGLAKFKKGNYNEALLDFQLLLSYNQDDVNALFYSAVSYYQIGNYNIAIQLLNKVLENANNAFHPEAKWNLALSNLKIGEQSTAKQLLQEIANEKGFYSKRAAEKLKGL